MSSELSHAIEKLRASTSKLNQLTDQAAETVRQVEQFLQEECSVGIPASVVFDKGNEVTDGYSVSWCNTLEYRRVGSKFRIAVVNWCDFAPEEEKVKAWSDWDRETKLKSLTSLPDLIVEIAKTLDSRLQDATTAVQTASGVMESLRARGEG